MQRIERTVINRRLWIEIRFDKACHGIQRHRWPDVGRAAGLWTGSREVGDQLVASNRQLQAAEQRLRAMPVAVEIAFGVIDAIWDLRDPAAHHSLRARNQLLDGLQKSATAEASEQALDMFGRFA